MALSDVTALVPQPVVSRRLRSSAKARREALDGYIWVSPWLIGFVAFTLVPLVASLLLGFTDWTGSGAIHWVGFANYVQLFTGDPLFWQSLKVTFIFAALYLPLSFILGFMLALLMNQPLRGMRILRTIYFAPSVLSGVAVAVMWAFIFNQNYGLLDWILGIFHLPLVPWLTSEIWVIPAIVLMQLWGVGGSMLIYLAGIQNVPTDLYDASRADGAGWWRRLWHVTLPMTSPTILFNVLLGLVASFQIFTQAYIITQGGPNYASYFYALNLYDTAFGALRLGYASAMATVLFVIVVGLSCVLFRWSRSRVFYAGRQ